MLRIVCTCAVLFLLHAVPASAQRRPEPLREGTYSLAFTIPTASTTSFGIWRLFSDRTAVGLDVNFNYRSEEHEAQGRVNEADGFSVHIGPALKRYFSPERTVAPFLYGAATVGYSQADLRTFTRNEDREAFDASGALGLGVDWFPLDRLSIGGFTGLTAGYSTTDRPGDHQAWSVRTFRSDLVMHIYFGGERRGRRRGR